MFTVSFAIRSPFAKSYDMKAIYTKSSKIFSTQKNYELEISKRGTLLGFGITVLSPFGRKRDHTNLLVFLGLFGYEIDFVIYTT